MNQYRDRIAIEFISALGMPPVEYVELATGLGCHWAKVFSFGQTRKSATWRPISIVPLQSKYASYADEARYNPLEPGKGELPLLDFLAALSGKGTIIGLEVPMLAQAEAGVTPHDRISACINSACELLRQAEKR
jgi:hypothetical protein